MTHSPANYRPGLTVRYLSATDTKGSRWSASLIRGNDPEYRVRTTVPYQDGPDAAAQAVVEKFNTHHGTAWVVDPSAISLDGGDQYVYGCGPI
jgi:hypothetical protein